MKTENVARFREGLLALRTRPQWEVAKIIASKFPKYDKNVIVRCSKITQRSSVRIDPTNIIDSITHYADNTDVLMLSETDSTRFDVAVQQLKMGCLTNLYLILLLSDGVILLEYSSKDIKTLNNFCGFQHSGNSDEAQFHINNKNIRTHLDTYMKEMLTYEQLYDMLSK